MESSSWSTPFGSPILATLATLLATLFLIALNAQARQRKKLPPGPWPWPIVGNFPSLSSGLPHRALEKLTGKYGGLMYLQLGAHPCIVVSTAAVAKEIFQHHDATFSSRPPGLTAEIVTGYKNVIMAPYGPYWRYVRRLCSNELFTPKRIASYEPARTQEFNTMMKIVLEQSQKGEAIHLKHWLAYVTVNQVTRMVMNKRFFGNDENQEEVREYRHLMSSLLETTGAFIISDFIPYTRFITRLQGWDKKIQEVRRLLFGSCKHMLELEKRRQRVKEDEGYVRDFVDVVLASRDKKELDDDGLMLMITDMLIAGSETNATTVEWAMTELIRQPDIIRKAQVEMDSVVGSDRVMQESDIPNLPYLQAIVKEAFRMHPPAPLAIPRESDKEVEIYGYKLPAHTRLILNVYMIHRDPAAYENPDEFNPERFMAHPEISATAGNDSYQLLPFGVGRRMCPGYALGNLLVHLILGHLLHSFDWSLPGNKDPRDLDMSEVFGIAIARGVPLSLMAKPRRPASFY